MKICLKIFEICQLDIFPVQHIINGLLSIKSIENYTSTYLKSGKEIHVNMSDFHYTYYLTP